MIRTTKIYANGGRYGKKKGDAFHGTWNFNTGSDRDHVKVIPQSIKNSQKIQRQNSHRKHQRKNEEKGQEHRAGKTAGDGI